MAESDESGLIGYDPLAWMEQDQADDGGKLQAETNQDKEAFVEQDHAAVETIVKEEALKEVEDYAMNDTDNVTMTLDSVLNIQHVGKLHEELLKILDLSNKIEIDASAVTSVDTASLQLLLVFKQSALKNGKELVIDFPSEKFIDAADLLGISEMLDIDHSPAGFFSDVNDMF